MTVPEGKAVPPAGDSDGTPRFGRLLMVLVCVLALIVAITVASAAYYQ